MLIFSVSSNFNICVAVANTITQYYLWINKKLVSSKAVFACGGTELPVICSFSRLPSCSARCLQQVSARCNLSQQSEIYARPYPLAVWRRCALPGHLRLLKILERFTNCVSSLRRGHANLLCIVSNFNICVAVANTMTQYYLWINKSLSLARQPLLVAALNCRSLLLLPATKLQREMPAAGSGSM